MLSGSCASWSAQILGAGGDTGAGRLGTGAVADLCIFDPLATWTVGANTLRSQGKHTPFSGYELPGRVRCTVVGGRVAFGG